MIDVRWKPGEESPLREVDIMPTKHEFEKEWVDEMESLRPAGAILRLGPWVEGHSYPDRLVHNCCGNSDWKFDHERQFI